MQPSRRVATAVVLAGFVLAACSISTGDSVYHLDRDRDPTAASRTAASEYGPVAIEDVQVGTGRVAQSTRKITVDLVVSDSGGGTELGRGRVTAVEPRPTGPAFMYVLTYDPGRLGELWPGIAGMREGGTRRFVVHTSCDARSVADCIVWGKEGTSITLPKHDALLVTATLVKVCAPRFRIVAYRSIPGPDHTYSVSETSCR